MVESLVEHPERLRLASALAEAPASAAELAELTELSPAKVRRELRAMKEEGHIESVKSEGRRGTVEHFYSVVGELFLDEDELAKLSIDQRRRMNSQILKLGIAEAIASLVTNPPQRGIERVDGAVARTPVLVDEDGWSEIAEIHEEAVRRMLEARKKIAARVEGSDAKLFRATSLIMLFESETRA
jgi:predicted ArsR family transcriptional regulator